MAANLEERYCVEISDNDAVDWDQAYEALKRAFGGISKFDNAMSLMRAHVEGKAVVDVGSKQEGEMACAELARTGIRATVITKPLGS
jgi:ATP-dependent Clp protease adapter protein ClpS